MAMRHLKMERGLSHIDYALTLHGTAHQDKALSKVDNILNEVEGHGDGD